MADIAQSNSTFNATSTAKTREEAQWDQATRVFTTTVAVYFLLLIYRIYRHKCKRKMPVFKKGGPIRFVEVEDWETRAWNRLIRWNDKTNDVMESFCGALGNAVLSVFFFIWKVLWWTLTTIVKFPFKFAKKYQELSEWLNMWMSHDFETKVDILEKELQGLAQRACQRIGHYLWLASLAVLSVIGKAFCGIWSCILALTTAVTSVFRFVYFCLWGIIKAIHRGYQLVVKGFRGICWYIGQGVISIVTGIATLPSLISAAGAATMNWFAQLPIFTIRQRRQQARAAKALEHATQEREAIAKKASAAGQQRGHARKGQRGKQQHHLPKQKPHSKSAAAAVPLSPLSESPVLQSASSKASNAVAAVDLASANKKHAAAVSDAPDSDQDVINAFKPAPPSSSVSSKAAANTASKPAAGEALSNRAAKAAARAQARAASQTPPKSAANSPPKAATNGPSKADANSPPKALSSSPPKATPNSPPKPAAISPVKDAAHNLQADKTAELIKAAPTVLPEDPVPVVKSLTDVKSVEDVTAGKQPVQADIVSSDIKLQKGTQRPAEDKAEPMSALPPKPTPKTSSAKTARRNTPAADTAHSSSPSQKAIAVPQPAQQPLKQRSPTSSAIVNASQAPVVAASPGAVVGLEMLDQLQEEVEDGDQQKCIVCWIEDRETTLAPCGHRVLCRGCTKVLLAGRKSGAECLCPICRSEVESYILKQYDA